MILPSLTKVSAIATIPLVGSAIYFAITDAVSISIITSCAAVVMAGMSAYLSYKTKAITAETHNAVNSRMDEFKELAKKFFHAEGVLQEKSDEKQRKDIQATGVLQEKQKQENKEKDKLI